MWWAIGDGDGEIFEAGFDEFNFEVGGVLLFLNTFGTEIIAALALPMLAAAAATFEDRRYDQGVDVAPQQSHRTTVDKQQPNEPQLERGTWNFNEHGVETNLISKSAAAAVQASSMTATTRPPYNTASTEEAFLILMERISGLILALSSVRTLLSAANISVQRGHLMLWAIFAPKFIFDATMQAVCGAAAVATWAIVLVAHRSYGCHRPSSSRGYPPGRSVSSERR